MNDVSDGGAPSGCTAFPQARTSPLHPPPGYSALRQQGPAVRVSLPDGSPAWVATTYPDIRRLLADPRLSADRSSTGFPALSPRARALATTRLPFSAMDPPEHTRRRGMVVPYFTNRRIRSLRPMIATTVEDALRELVTRTPPVDLVTHFALPVTSTVIGRLLGLPDADQRFFRETSHRLARPDTAHEAGTAAAELTRYLEGLVERPHDLQPGLLADLVGNQLANGELDRADLVRTGLLLLFAGHETTASMITLGVITLLRHPDQLDAMLSEPELVPSAVEELLRYLSIADLATIRLAIADVPMGDTVVPAGDAILLPTAMANRDRAAFPDPDRFDIRRDSRLHLAFGHGTHQCLGHNLARLELQIALPELFRRMPRMHLARPLAELSFSDAAATVHSVTSLPISW